MKFSYQRLLTVIVIMIAIVNISQAQPKRNSILFFSIDNWVEVYVEGEMVFKKASDAGNLKQPVEFDLNPFIQGIEEPLVEIKLINAKCTTCDTSNGWIIEFEVFQDGESVDYMLEKGDSMGGDTVFTMIYEWGYI
ncbi:hypothetical protein SAMN04488029_3436 [Reichenbachiella faecimaris]|uniref:Uncharacterized protein n=1 Tax=Reichenbachiella faecimaris TaxID=692418 RepID=A0A1W2GN97_REIFA|nr:hypothetical protein [Reichenbachiella faecimaris]SMD37736.1 hypothetical protein SAMN04488029_3436 [Reichenbachiella faecimaris]